MTRLVNRNITTPTGRSSMRLEPELWEAVREICLRQNQTMAEWMAGLLPGGRGATKEGRTSIVRTAIFLYFKAAATEAGHTAAGHGPLQGVAEDYAPGRGR